MAERKPYPSDVSDERWALIEPVLAAWKAGRPSTTNHEGRYEMREIVNAIVCRSRTGRQWAYLPGDLPPSGAVYHYFGLWRDDGTDQNLHDLLRRQVMEVLPPFSAMQRVSRRHRGSAPRWDR
ncbi:transposase [Streptomyces sp. NPDC056831]|uniref:transposase n=1 Tax=Streptomyces sp. NPDC056831 TaxID=3345954 RepID=UPI00368D0C24